MPVKHHPRCCRTRNRSPHSCRSEGFPTDRDRRVIVGLAGVATCFSSHREGYLAGQTISAPRVFIHQSYRSSNEPIRCRGTTRTLFVVRLHSKVSSIIEDTRRMGRLVSVSRAFAS